MKIEEPNTPYHHEEMEVDEVASFIKRSRFAKKSCAGQPLGNPEPSPRAALVRYRAFTVHIRGLSCIYYSRGSLSKN